MARARRKLEGWLEPPAAEAERGCEWPGCRCFGLYRAPVSRDRLYRYRWFCLDHVREYNAGWNYYTGMTEEEIEADLRLDTVWRRPSWRIGTAPGGAFADDSVADPLGLFGGCGADRRRPWSVEERAMAVLDLHPPVSFDALRARYRELVKRHHPDANGGDKAAEEKFKEIHEAYQTLMPFVTA